MRVRIAALVIGGIAAAALGLTAYRVIDADSDASKTQSDRAIQANLRDALQAQKTFFVTNERYASAAKMRATEPTFAWGNEITVVVGNVSDDDGAVVCLSQRSPSGTTFAIADVARGPRAGLYYGVKACPDPATPDAVAALGTAWDRGARKQAKQDADAADKTALRNASAVMQRYYAERGTYTSSPAALRSLDAAIDWGGTIQIVVADAVAPGDTGVACMWTTSERGNTYAVGHVAVGAFAGVYYAAQPCPVPATPEEVAAFATGW